MNYHHHSLSSQSAPHAGPQDQRTAAMYAQWLQQYQYNMMQYSYMKYYSEQMAKHYPESEQSELRQRNFGNAEEQTENVPQAANAEQPNPVVRLPQQDAVDVGEEDGRDWLDSLFALTRICFLLSIVYFYSSTYRFAMTLFVFVVIYLYQAGYFQVNRRNVNPNPIPNDQQPRIDGNNNQNDDNQDSESRNAETSGETESANIPVPSIFATAWCFVRSFFTSLVPTGPA